MKCMGCGADLSENEAICPYCDTVVVPNREQKGNDASEYNANVTLWEKMKNLIKAFWRKKDLFSKICTVIAFLIAILTVVAIATKNRGAIIIAILQIAALVIAVLMHKGTIDAKKKWIKYVVLGVAVLLTIANVTRYSVKERPQNDTTRPAVQSSTSKETKVYTPYGANDCVGKMEQDIEKGFRQAGFTNINKDVIPDLEIKDAVKDGSIENITINGISDFSGNEEFPSSARIVIKYHSFKKIEAPIDSEIAKTTSTEELVQLFKAAGFVNITTDEVVDLDPDSTSEEFENVVTIDGISSFTHTANFPINASVNIITHKTFEKYTLKVNVNFVSNLIFSKYDVDLNVNGETNRILHGEDGEFEYRLTPGKYTITFTNAESSSVKGTTEIDLTGDTEATFKISCFNDKIAVETMAFENRSAIREDEVMVPNAASTYKNKNYQEVEKELKNAGFNNITTEILYDIIWGVTEEGAVETVTIDGKTDYIKGDIFSQAVPVIITYHMKDEEDPNKQKDNTEEKTEEKQEKPGATTTDSTVTPDDKKESEEIIEETVLYDSEVKDAICALMDTSIDSNAYHVSIDGSLVNIYCYPKGLTLTVYNATVNKDKESIKAWNSLVKSSKEFNKSITKDVHDVMGRKDLRVALYYYDDSGSSEMVYLCIMEGVVFYDIVNGIDLLGLG